MMSVRFKSLLIVMITLTLTLPLAGKEVVDELAGIKRDIILLNLVNGLNLSEDQSLFIIQQINAAERVRNSQKDRMEEQFPSYFNTLSRVKNILLKDEDVPADLARQVHQLKTQKYRLDDEAGFQIHRIEEAIIATLTKNQLTLIDTYSPCTIPPKQGRIGQSTESALEGIGLMLNRIRRMETFQYDMVKEMIIDKHLDKIERHLGRVSQKERKEVVLQWEESLESARTLSDQDYMVKRGEIAQSLLPEDNTIRRLKKNQLSKVGHFLLDPALKPILNEKLRNS